MRFATVIAGPSDCEPSRRAGATFLKLRGLSEAIDRAKDHDRPEETDRLFPADNR